MHPAICALVEFAAQNPGIDLANYGFDANGRRAYRSESRSITHDWKRFQNALWEALASGVTDAEVIAEAPHAFSGRLEWKTTATKWEGQAPNCTKREVPTDPHWENFALIAQRLM